LPSAACLSRAPTLLFGAVGGGRAGFNWQSGAMVVGAEADFDWSNAKGSISAQCAAAACGAAGPVPLGDRSCADVELGESSNPFDRYDFHESAE
jgi:hypothetical protein